MRNATAPLRLNRRPFTNRLAVAALLATGLLTGILTAVVPATGAMATEATPTASASASASAKAADKDEVATVGAGMLIALSDIALFEADGAGVVGSLEAGESAEWSRIDDRPTPALYVITTDAGLEASVSSGAVFAFPKDGQKLDKSIVIKEGNGKSDPMSGFGGKLKDVMVIRDAPSRSGAEIAKLQVGQKFPQASAPAEGESNVMGSSMFVTVLLDPETKQYGFIHSAATAIDKHPEEPEVLEAAPTDDATDEQPESTAVATETETAAVTASAVAVVPATEAPRPGTVDAEGEEKKADGDVVLIAGLGGAVVLLIGGGVVARKRKSKKAAAEDDDAAKPAKKVVAVDADEDSETDVAVVPAEPEAEDVDWDSVD